MKYPQGALKPTETEWVKRETEMLFHTLYELTHEHDDNNSSLTVLSFRFMTLLCAWPFESLFVFRFQTFFFWCVLGRCRDASVDVWQCIYCTKLHSSGSNVLLCAGRMCVHLFEFGKWMTDKIHFEPFLCAFRESNFIACTNDLHHQQHEIWCPSSFSLLCISPLQPRFSFTHIMRTNKCAGK